MNFPNNRRRFTNNPNTVIVNGEPHVRRFVHKPMTLEHQGVNISIKENGKVTLNKVAGPDPENPSEMLVDEIEVSASVIYKAINMIETTRELHFIKQSEVSKSSAANESSDKQVVASASQ